jgi:hypothetical protein
MSVRLGDTKPDFQPTELALVATAHAGAIRTVAPAGIA